MRELRGGLALVLRSGPRPPTQPEVREGSRAAVAGRLIAQPVYPQLRNTPCVPALTLRARFGRRLGDAPLPPLLQSAKESAKGGCHAEIV